MEGPIPLETRLKLLKETITKLKRIRKLAQDTSRTTDSDNDDSDETDNNNEDDEDKMNDLPLLQERDRCDSDSDNDSDDESDDDSNDDEEIDEEKPIQPITGENLNDNEAETSTTHKENKVGPIIVVNCEGIIDYCLIAF